MITGVLPTHFDNAEAQDPNYVSFFRFPDTQWDPGVNGPIYKSVGNFSAADRQLLSNITIDQNTFRNPQIFDSFKNTEGILYEFRNVTFQDVPFSASRLMNARFVQCTFENCQFTGSVLTGAVFEECTATAANPQSLRFSPLVAYGALVDIKFSKVDEEGAKETRNKLFEEAPAEVRLETDEVGELAPASFMLPRP